MFFSPSSLTLSLSLLWKNKPVLVAPSVHEAVLNLVEDVPKMLLRYILNRHVGMIILSKRCALFVNVVTPHPRLDFISLKNRLSI